MHKRELCFLALANSMYYPFKISARGLFLEYSFNFANFILYILTNNKIYYKKCTSFSCIIIIYYYFSDR